MAGLGPLTDEIVLPRFTVSDDAECSRRSYTGCSVAG